jgi:hypothetical protein
VNKHRDVFPHLEYRSSDPSSIDFGNPAFDEQPDQSRIYLFFTKLVREPEQEPEFRLRRCQYKWIAGIVSR